MRAARAAAWIVAGALVLTVGAAAFDAQRSSAPAPSQGSARTRLAAVVSPVIDAIWTGYDRRAAMDHVEFIGTRWRLPWKPQL
jgi:hypothetical protein